MKSTAAAEDSPINGVPMAVPVYGSFRSYGQETITIKRDSLWYALTSPVQLFTWKQLIFQVANLLLAVIALVAIAAGLTLSLALLPFCCVGIALLKALFQGVHCIAQMDARLFNWLAPLKEHITVSFEFAQNGHEHDHAYCLAPGVAPCSLDLAMAVLYYACIKFPLAVVITGSLFALLSMSFACLLSPWSLSVESASHIVNVEFLQQQHAILVFILGLLGVYLATFLLHKSTRIIQLTTQFCASKSFHIYSADISRYEPIQGRQTLFVQI
ncbi:hypothetical protein LEN26_010949 [Aphanomyces euteiches]|nr:hypothetical protein LEN26_010949 [Aphanomyces euteiches]